MTEKHTHHEAQKHDHKKHGFSLFRLVLGAAVATGASYYYVTHKEQVDDAAKKKINELAKKLNESKVVVEKKVAKVWGKVSKDAVLKYVEVRKMILENLQAENLEKHGNMLKQRYEQIVEKAIKSAKKSGILTPEVEQKLERLYKMDWNDIKRVMEIVFQEAKKAAGNVKKAVAKPVVKKAAPKAAKRAAGASFKKATGANSAKKAASKKSRAKAKKTAARK